MRNSILPVSVMACARAQWSNYTQARTPRTKDGKPNLTAPVLRMNGKPDLPGVWMKEGTPREELERILEVFEDRRRGRFVHLH